MQNITPILRTRTLKELLIELFFRSDKPRTLSDLARSIDVDQTTVMREVNRLLKTGVVVEERVGRSRTVAVDTSSPVAAPLENLIRLELELDDVGRTPAGRGTRQVSTSAGPTRKESGSPPTPRHRSAYRAEKPRRRPLPSSRRKG